MCGPTGETRQNLLFLAHRIPYPPDKGDKIRTWNILRHLCRTHRVFVGALIDDRADWAHVPALAAHCAELACFSLHPRRQKLRALLKLSPGRPLTLDYFHSPGLARWVRQIVARETIERVFVACSAMAPYAMRLRASRRILDFMDVDSTKWTQYAAASRGPARLIFAREGRTLHAFEREVASHVDHALFVSEQEWRHFQALAPESAERTSFISNGVDFAYFSPSHHFENPYREPAAVIVFTGAMDYRPNIEAVQWFVRAVLPLVRKAGHAQAAFWIVGANPAAEVRRLAALPGVHVTGRVADTRPYLAHAQLAVAPLRLARGIQNKVLEAMAMGTPVVTTPQAFEGLRAAPGRDLLIAETAEDMAHCVRDVLEGRHPSLGANARALVERQYDWSTMLAALDRLWEPGQPATGSAMDRSPKPASCK